MGLEWKEEAEGLASIKGNTFEIKCETLDGMILRISKYIDGEVAFAIYEDGDWSDSVCTRDDGLQQLKEFLNEAI